MHGSVVRGRGTHDSAAIYCLWELVLGLIDIYFCFDCSQSEGAAFLFLLVTFLVQVQSSSKTVSRTWTRPKARTEQSAYYLTAVLF